MKMTTLRQCLSLLTLAAACGGGGSSSQTRSYDASCAEVAGYIQNRCVEASDQPCSVYRDVYETCRAEVEAGRPVRVCSYCNSYVPAEKPPAEDRSSEVTPP